ncbi:hypothetical protein [Paenibacillus thiaminolyticus]|uniref:hypothetical protein n=1 Tax=Paenibacillus thiaminolyticus TaxID=49283 RepID=UPI0011C37B73|nr:hypothetical protein [Paenibacillus thiaminolyticus]
MAALARLGMRGFVFSRYRRLWVLRIHPISRWEQLTHPLLRSTMAGEASTPPAGGGAIFEDSGWNYL